MSFDILIFAKAHFKQYLSLTIFWTMIKRHSLLCQKDQCTFPHILKSM